MRHVGQGFEIRVPLDSAKFDSASVESLRELFLSTYESLFERRVESVPVEILSWRLSARARQDQTEYSFEQRQTDSADACKGEREVYFPGFGKHMTQVYDRYSLSAGQRFDGPAVIEERESTTIVGPDASIRVDDFLNLRIDIEG